VDQTSKPTQSGSWLKWLVFGLLLLASLAAVLWLLPSTPSKIQARIDALKKAGYPVTAQDLAKMYPALPDDQNSVVIYQKAFARQASLPVNVNGWPVVSPSTYPFSTQPVPPEMKPGIARYVNRNENTLALLHQAAGIQNGYYDNGFKNGFSNIARMPFEEIRQSAQLLALATILRAEDRQPAAATELLLDSFGLPRSLEHDPQMGSVMMRDTIVRLNCSDLELTLNKTPLSEDELRSLAAAFHEAEPADGLKQALIYVRCQGIWLRDQIMASPFKHPNETLKAKLNDLYFRAVYYRPGDFIFYLDLMDGYVAALDLPYPARIQKARQLFSKATQSPESTRALGTLLLVNWEKSFLMDATTRAELFLSETALAIERYQLANHGQLPETLPELVPACLPAVPTDPFNGRPICYQKLTGGYRIYSVGEDGVDNGGRKWNPDTKTGDLTFTVWQ
jgi:hypothetical protein